MSKQPIINLKPGREKSLLRRHPWIFSGAIQSVTGNPKPGETVVIKTAQNKFIAQASWSPESQISGRVWTFNGGDYIDQEFLKQRIANAVALREKLPSLQNTDACRLVASEADALPGVIIDRYGDFLVGQFASQGAEKWKREIAAAAMEITGCKGFYERSDVSVRKKEGLPESTGLLAGENPPEQIEISENDLKYLVDIRHGHKTGFYLDQRENRAALQGFCDGAEVLNCFSYTGGFGVAAHKFGAKSVLNVDSSEDALALAAKNMELNGVSEADYTNVRGDVFKLLREYRKEGRQFDVIVLDPPKFIESKASLERASRGYKDINMLALQLIRPGGCLFTFSCSGLMTADLFNKVVAGAALDANREAVIVKRLSQAADHPTPLAFPEGFYLKGLVLKIN
jgi:23S rRNA (cytosine1962-C5)-methyltransferase